MFFISIISLVGVGVAASIMGCFVVWKRDEYLGDSISHCLSAGAALGLVLDNYYVFLCSTIVLVVLLLEIFSFKDCKANTMSIVSCGFLSTGIICMFFFGDSHSEDFDHIFLGNIEEITIFDIAAVYGFLVFVLICVVLRWKKWLLMVISKDLVKVSGSRAWQLSLEYHLCLAILIAIYIKIVGVVVASSLLIIPPTIVSNFSYSPLRMVFYSIFVSLFCLFLGWGFAFYFSIPVGTTIVLVAFIIYVLVSLVMFIRSVL